MTAGPATLLQKDHADRALLLSDDTTNLKLFAALYYWPLK